VRWKIVRSFDGQLSREYSNQKLLISGNISSNYNRKCRGCFLKHGVYCELCYDKTQLVVRNVLSVCFV